MSQLLSLDAPSRDCLVVGARVANPRPDGRFELQVDPNDRCSTCSGACMWRRTEGRNLGPFTAARAMTAGERVIVSLPAISLLMVAVFLYGLPLFLMLTGALMGAYVATVEFAAVLGAFVGLFSGLSLVSWLSPRVQQAALSGLSIRATTT